MWREIRISMPFGKSSRGGRGHCCLISSVCVCFVSAGLEIVYFYRVSDFCYSKATHLHRSVSLLAWKTQCVCWVQIIKESGFTFDVLKKT